MGDQLDAVSRTRPASRGEPELLGRHRHRLPVGAVLRQRRQRRRRVERRDAPVAAERLRLGGEATGLEQRVERPVLREQGRGGLGADAACARDLVRGVAAERDEVRDLLRLDAVPLADLGRPDPRDLAHAAHRLQDRHVVGDQLERVAVRRRDERRPAPRSLGGHGGAEEVVRLEARRLAAHDPARLEQPRRKVELLEELGVELAAGLVAGQQLVPVGRDEQRVPADDDGTRPLRLPEPEEHRREAGQQVPGPAVRAADRARQCVEGAVGERVAVDDEQRRAHGDSPPAAASSEVIASRSRSVASVGRLRGVEPAQIAQLDRRAVRDAERPEALQPVGADDAGRDERHTRLERDSRRPAAPPRLVTLAKPLRPAGALGEHDDGVPCAAERDGGVDRLLVAHPAVDREPTACADDPAERQPEELLLRHEAEEAAREQRDPERPRVEVRPVVRGEHAAAVRDVLATRPAQPVDGAQNGPAERLRRAEYSQLGLRRTCHGRAGYVSPATNRRRYPVTPHDPPRHRRVPRQGADHRRLPR